MRDLKRAYGVIGVLVLLQVIVVFGFLFIVTTADNKYMREAATAQDRAVTLETELQQCAATLEWSAERTAWCMCNGCVQCGPNPLERER